MFAHVCVSDGGSGGEWGERNKQKYVIYDARELISVMKKNTAR